MALIEEHCPLGLAVLLLKRHAGESSLGTGNLQSQVHIHKSIGIAKLGGRLWCGGHSLWWNGGFPLSPLRERVTALTIVA